MYWREERDSRDVYLVEAPAYRVHVWPLPIGDRFLPVRLHPLALRYDYIKPLHDAKWIPPQYLANAQTTLESAQAICLRHYHAASKK